MDPQLAWGMLLNSYSLSDWETVKEVGESLLSWLDRGGFPPKTVENFPMDRDWHVEIARFACKFAIQKARDRMIEDLFDRS